MDRAQDSDMGHLLGDWCQSENKSEIKSLLVKSKLFLVDAWMLKK